MLYRKLLQKYAPEKDDASLKAAPEKDDALQKAAPEKYDALQKAAPEKDASLEAPPETDGPKDVPDKCKEEQIPFSFAEAANPNNPAPTKKPARGDPVLTYYEQFKTEADKIKVGKRLHSCVWHSLTFSNKFGSST